VSGQARNEGLKIVEDKDGTGTRRRMEKKNRGKMGNKKGKKALRSCRGREAELTPTGEPVLAKNPKGGNRGGEGGSQTSASRHQKKKSGKGH